jgi:hypothetical protein
MSLFTHSKMPAYRSSAATLAAARREATAHRNLCEKENLANGIPSSKTVVSPQVKAWCEEMRLSDAFARYVETMVPTVLQHSTIVEEANRIKEEKEARRFLLQAERRNKKAYYIDRLLEPKKAPNFWHDDPVKNGWAPAPAPVRPLLPSFKKETSPSPNQLRYPPPAAFLPQATMTWSHQHAMKNSIVRRKAEYDIVVDATSKRLFNFQRKLRVAVKHFPELQKLFDDFEKAKDRYKESWKQEDVDWSHFKKDCKLIGAISKDTAAQP